MGHTICGGLIALTGMVAGIASAQAQYPNKPIRLIVPSAPGGLPDINARLIASELSKQMVQQVVVDNRPGAGGLLGYEMMAKAAPDGYNLGYATFALATNPSLVAKLPFDATRDFQMVIHQVSSPNVLATNLSLPVKSPRELIKYARANPGKLSFGSPGNGTSMHLSMELLKNMTGTQLLHVPYKGIQQAITDTIGGQLQVVCDNMGSILSHVKSGSLRGLGVTTLKRSALVPDLPTLAESGLPGYEMAPWSGYIFQTGVAREILLRLNAEINKALTSSIVLEKFAAQASTPVGGTPEQFAEHVRRETTKWAKVIKDAGIKPE
jgi:tripartite-type tricarboxylate transporter receptor subunit TctC